MKDGRSGPRPARRQRGELLWAATLGTAYALIVTLVLAGFTLVGWLDLNWTGALLALPLLFLASLAFATLGLLFTAIVPSIDHMKVLYLKAVFSASGQAIWTCSAPPTDGVPVRYLPSTCRG